MRRGKLIAGLVLGLVVVVTSGSFAAYRWVKRTFGAHSTAPATDAAASNKQPALPPAVMPPIVIKGAVMGQAFRSGKLPAPLPQPAGAPEQAAAELAKRVMAEDDQSTAALITALQMSGFSVRGDDGSLAYESVKPGQGIVIDAWEVAALAKLFGDGMRTNLTDFSNAFAATLRLKKTPVAKLLLDGLRTSAQSDQPARRFWADFIAELGRQSEKSYDLLAPDVDTAKVELDAIQVSLVLRRLVADLMLLDGNKKQKAQWRRSERDWKSPRWKPTSCQYEEEATPQIRDAVWHSDHGPRLLFVQEGGGSKGTCTMSELVSQVMDMTAYGYTKAFDSMLEYMKENEWAGAEGYQYATAAINALLSVVKLIAYYACMETDITMSGDPPLVRTQSIFQPGEKRTLTATVRENIGKWQTLNCARIALNGVNLDISLPNDGPVAGVKTQWVLTSGGDEISGGDVTYRIVEFVSPDGTAHVQAATGDISNSSAPKTDEEGHTTIDIEGVKQREQLSSPIPIMKQAAVRFTVAAKPVTMKQDLIDAAGLGIAGGVALGFGGPVEMLLRANIYFSKQLSIPVKDWESCDGGWAGTMSYATKYHWDHNDPVHRMSESNDQTITYEVRVKGNPNSGTGWNGSSHGSFTAAYSKKFVGIAQWPGGSRPGFYVGPSTITTEENTTAAGGGETNATISPLGDNKYTVGAGSFNIPGVDLWHTTCAGDCRGKPTPDKNDPFVFSLAFPPVTTQEDPNQPGELHGSTTLEDSPMKFATTKVSWNLHQCQDRR